MLLTAQPRMKRVVAERRKALTKAIEGLGQHGLVGKQLHRSEKTSATHLAFFHFLSSALQELPMNRYSAFMRL